MLLPIIAFVLFGALFFMKDVLPGKPSQLDLWSTITKYTYQNQLAKVLFAIPGTKLATTQQVAHFTVPKSWLVLSSKQATRLKQAAANPTNQATLKTQATAYVTAHVQSDLKALAAKAQAGDQAAQAQLANQTQLTQSLAAKYQRAFTRQALLKLSSH